MQFSEQFSSAFDAFSDLGFWAKRAHDEGYIAFTPAFDRAYDRAARLAQAEGWNIERAREVFESAYHTNSVDFYA